MYDMAEIPYPAPLTDGGPLTPDQMRAERTRHSMLRPGYRLTADMAKALAGQIVKAEADPGNWYPLYGPWPSWSNASRLAVSQFRRGRRFNHVTAGRRLDFTLVLNRDQMWEMWVRYGDDLPPVPDRSAGPRPRTTVGTCVQVDTRDILRAGAQTLPANTKEDKNE